MTGRRGGGPRAEATGIALVFQPLSAEAKTLVERSAQVLKVEGYAPRVVPALETGPSLDSSDLRMAITFGGDGTIIRAARWLAGTGVPILGVAMGKLGFLTELAPDGVPDSLPRIVAGDYWIDERSMLSARVRAVQETPASQAPSTDEAESGAGPLLALNDVVIGRGASPRIVQIDIMVDGTHLVQYVADAMILATPTGSTAYALSAGGPVLAPGVEGLVLVPLAPHLAVLKSLVVPVSARIDVRASSEQPPLMVLDGQEQVPLRNGQIVTVQVAKERSLFARTGSRTKFYETLVQSYGKKR